MVSQNYNVILEQYEQASAVNCDFKHPAEVLFLPPEFVQIVGALVGHKISIQNMDGKIWNVKLALVDGDLAFEEGWSAFFQDNDLRHADMLAFSCINESHFSVDILERSTVCQKNDYSQERTKVYKKYKKNPVLDPFASGSKLPNSETSLVTSPSASVTNVEDPICMLYRAAVDLEKASSIATALPHFHVEEKKEIHGEDSQPPMKHFKEVGDDFNGLSIDKLHSKPFDDEHPRKVIPDDNSNRMVKEAVFSKKELIESSKQSVGSAHQLSHGNSPIVKSEPDFLWVPSVDAGSFKVRVKSQAYLELPVCISSSSNLGAKKIVSLKDSSGRYWPMIFHELRFVRGLSGMWSGFCEANGVEPGDVCEFHLENDIPCIYTVIVHKSGSTS